MERRNLIQYLMLEEADDDDLLLSYLTRRNLEEDDDKENSEDERMLDQQRNADADSMFRKVVEGYGANLQNQDLLTDVHDDRFRGLFPFNFRQFRYLLDLVRDDVSTPSFNRVKNPIKAEAKLALTLRVMATGERFRTLQSVFGVSHGHISKLVRRTLSVLRIKLSPLFLPSLSLGDKKKIAEEFQNKLNFPNCIGAVDGRYIRIGPLAVKKFPILVLFAVVDANSKFIMVDVGSYGNEGDKDIFEKSNMAKEFHSGTMFPDPCELPNTDAVLPYIFTGDKTFKLHRHVMTPFTIKDASLCEKKAIFNERISKARTVSENAFGLLSQVFKIFRDQVALKLESAQDMIIVACCLHNLLLDAFLETENKPFFALDPLEPECTLNLISLRRTKDCADADGFLVRDSFKDYFHSHQGRISPQET